MVVAVDAMVVGIRMAERVGEDFVEEASVRRSERNIFRLFSQGFEGWIWTEEEVLGWRETRC